MRPVLRVLLAMLTIAGCVAAAAPAAQAQATRTWVSSQGDDANPCSRTATCRTLQGARPKTAVRGEINAVDPGSYGTLTIPSALTVDLDAVKGRVFNDGLTGIVVDAGATSDVVLRGLQVSGVGTGGGGGCAYTGIAGIEIRSARSVSIENTTITAQNIAVRVIPTATPPTVFLKNVTVRNACTAGVDVAPTGTGSASVSITRSTISSAGTALRVADGGRAWLSASSVFGNTIGLQTIGTGEINVYYGDQVHDNATDGTPTTVIGAPDDGPDGAVGATGDPGATGSTGATGSVGAQGPAPFQVVLPKTNLTAVSGTRVSLRYIATGAARSTLTVTRGGKTVATVKGRARSGKNTIAWNGKRGRKAAAAGKYTLVLRATSTGGDTVTTRAKVRLKRAR